MSKKFKKTVSLLLAVLMVVTMLPVTAIAEEIENLGCTHHPFHTEECGYAEAAEEVPCAHACPEECGEVCSHEHDENCGYVPASEGAECTFHCEKCEADVIYSDETFCLNGSSVLAEEGGKSDFILSREETGKEVSATLVIYDYSANYGKDYIIFANGEEIAKTEGSKSFYDLLAENGEAISGIEIDASLAALELTGEESSEDIKASDMFAEFDVLGIRAAEIPVTFAPEEDSILFTVEAVDDSESEYDESFMLAVFDEKGEAVETALALVTIEDNEEKPEVKITFDCEAELELGEDGKATLSFKREGNLATNSLAVLYHDGEPLGYIDFAPYQEEQTVEAVYAGVYMLGDENGNITDMTEIRVSDPMASEYNVPEGADPVLDAVPESYATIPDAIGGNPSWFPEWAKTTGKRETETQIIDVGTPSDSRWQNDSNSSKGSTIYFPDNNNYVAVETSGTGSHLSSGTNKIRSITYYNLTGIAGIEVVGNLSGVDKNAKIGLEANDCTGWHKTVESGGTYTMTATVPAGYQKNTFFYVYNRDPQSSGGGTNFNVANGWILHKRMYYFEVLDDRSPNLSYYGEIETHPSVDGNNDLIKIYPGTNNESYNKINIIYNADSAYPAKLVGYKLHNSKTNTTSELFKLNGTNGFYFTFDFLKKYESTYCWQGDADGDGNGDSVFSIIPVYEKIGVNYEIKSSKGGSVTLKNPNGNLYMGDYAVFENSASSELELTGIEWKAYTNLSSDIAASGTMDADADGLVRFKLNNVYSRYEFKGIYSADAASLSVFYAEENPQGKILTEGIVVPADKYIKNDFVTLTAQPNQGYITKWIVDTDVYCGNVLYYQLTGNPDYNKIYVSFIPESEAGVVSKNINGVLNSSNVNLMTGENTPSKFTNAEITITGGEKYSAKSDEDGNYSISGFKGVPGGTYTVLISYENGFDYKKIIFEDSGSYILTVPQFAVGDCYPINVTANLSGGDSSSNMIPLETGGTVNIRVAVQGQKNSKPTGVTLHFYDTVNNLGSVFKYKIIEETESIGEVSYWDVGLYTENIPVNTRLYISVDSEKTMILRDENGNYIGSETYTATSATADGGYEFSVDYEDSTIPVYYDVPSTPQPADAADVFHEDLNIPLLGSADFSLSSSNGGFFITRTDPDTGYIYLMCGYSFEGLYAKGHITDKYDSAKKSVEAGKKHSIGKKTTGSSEPAVQTMTGNENNETGGGNEAPDTGAKKPSSWTFSPAFMFQISAKPGTDDPNTYYIVGYETIVGFDAWYFKNFPFNVYGVPMYISVSFGLEAVLQMALNFKEDAIALEDVNNENIALGNYLKGAESSIAAIEGIIGAPKLAVGIKGGVGANNFLSAFVEASVRIPILFQFAPQFQVGGQIGFDVAAGADLVIFTGKLSANLLDVYYGDNEDDDDDGNGIINDEGDSDVVGDLKTIQGQVNSVALYNSANGSEANYIDSENFDFEEEFNKMTFTLMSRTGGTNLRAISDPSTVAEDTFKSTGVHLWEFGNGKLAAAYLRDNGKEGINYLSAVYAVSDDGGKTWSEEKYFSDNTSAEGSSLQYDINIFELEDRILVTWSEADFDKLISEMGLDPNKLTATQVAKLMGAMNLRGAFIDKYDGSLIGEVFTIAENSTVACSVIDAVQSGENVYVYYQRNAIRYGEEYNTSDLLNIERTIAIARTDVNDSQNWISTPVRVENENNQQYRIVDVEPFAFNGIVGEVIAIDRDGKFAVQKADGSWENSDDDRVLVLRTYRFSEETGEPETAALTLITDASTSSQKPQVVSDGKDVYLFFNQDGNIVYLKNFVANEDASEEIKNHSAFAIRNSDGSYSVNNPPESNAKNIASHGNFHYGSKFSVTMDENGDILICWIADEQKEGVLLATEEIYGLMLRNISNGKAFELMGIEDEEMTAEEAAYEQLWAVGNPVAITDENGLFGALDSICTDAEKGEFLLGYTKLSSELKSTAAAADVKVVNGDSKPEIVIESIEYDAYPMPGTETEITVTVSNNGFKALSGISVTAKGSTLSGRTESEKTLWPGTTESYAITVNIPENFSKTETLEITAFGIGGQSVFSAETSAEIIYGAYFTVDDVIQRSIPGTKDVSVTVGVTNIGNASGIPEFTVRNSIFGEEDDEKQYSFKGEKEVEPGETASVESILEDTYINKEQTARISVRTGESSDQFIQEFMPKPAITVLPGGETDSEEKPGHEHKWSDWVTEGNRRSRKCSDCGIVEFEYIYSEKTDGEENPATGSVIITFEKCGINYIDISKVSGKKRRR